MTDVDAAIETLRVLVDDWTGELTGDVGCEETAALEALAAEVKRLRRRSERLRRSYCHNHMTRDIKDRGECPACDRYHVSAEVERLRGENARLKERLADSAIVIERVAHGASLAECSPELDRVIAITGPRWSGKRSQGIRRGRD